VVGNSSDMEGMDIVNNGTSIEVCFDPMYKSDNFNLVFMDRATREVITEVVVYRGSGGGSSTKYVYKNLTEYVYRNITEYFEVNSTDGENETIEDPIVIPEEEHGFFWKLWDWINGLFRDEE